MILVYFLLLFYIGSAIAFMLLIFIMGNSGKDELLDWISFSENDKLNKFGNYLCLSLSKIGESSVYLGYWAHYTLFFIWNKVFYK